MTRFFSSLAIIAYLALAAAALLWWAPHFFVANVHYPPELGFRYIAGTGIPFGLLMATIVARQSLMPRFSLVLFLQLFLAGGFLWLAIYTYYYPPQANFFCQAHLVLSLAFVLWNLYQYRRALQQMARYKAATV